MGKIVENMLRTRDGTGLLLSEKHFKATLILCWTTKVQKESTDLDKDAAEHTSMGSVETVKPLRSRRPDVMAS
jgi:hypothetical protein